MFHGLKQLCFQRLLCSCYASGGVCATAGPLAEHDKTGTEKFRCARRCQVSMPSRSLHSPGRTGRIVWSDNAWPTTAMEPFSASKAIRPSYGIDQLSDYLRLFIGNYFFSGNPYCPTLPCRVGSPAEKLMPDHDRAMVHVIMQATTACNSY